MDSFKISLLAVLLLCYSQAGQALELFGIDLESANRDELRNAVKQAGVVLIREGGDDEWFDLYDSSSVLDGSSRLYLGFVKQSGLFAFAEYEFNGLDAEPMLGNLTAKYGNANVRKGFYISDQSYYWQLDGIEIRLHSDWQNYKTRLSYIMPANLISLQTEQAAANKANPDEAAETAVSFY